jgi:RimJ/RimL family protein N-acetyltransferase
MKIEKTETFIEHDIILEGTKIGTVELCPEHMEISRLVIFEPYQNKGYGTEVVQSLVTQGYKSLWVRSDNPRAIHVYEKCGFKRGETHMFEMVAESEDKE